MRAARSQAFTQFMSSLGGTVVGSTPDEFRQYQDSERVKWKRIIDDAGVNLE